MDEKYKHVEVRTAICCDSCNYYDEWSYESYGECTILGKSVGRSDVCDEHEEKPEGL